MMNLSILIATMPKRKFKFHRLLSKLESQIPMRGGVEILWDDSMEYNIGVKRNKLLERAIGKWVVFIDDDDDISSDYTRKILQALKDNPDCVGISGTITTNGKNLRQWHISKEYITWHTENKVYLRTPNHISPVRRELALKVKFPEIKFGEDAVYSQNLLPLLKTEVVIEGNIYHYKYNSLKK